MGLTDQNQSQGEMKTFLKAILILFGVLIAISAGYLFYLRNCEWSPEVAAQYATQHAENKSVGLCAKYVRKAMIAGGIPLFMGGNAWQYKSMLPLLKFAKVDSGDKPKVGDIVVFQPIGSRKYGHVAIWNGRQWVSDFKQRSMFVHSDYKRDDCEYAIFRKE